jgi:hypothetical protein
MKAILKALKALLLVIASVSLAAISVMFMQNNPEDAGAKSFLIGLYMFAAGLLIIIHILEEP